MKRLAKSATLITLSFLIMLPPVSHATNGYFLIGYGAKSRGMGGVGVAYAQDALAAAANPAGIAFVGSRVDAGLEFFNPPRRVGGGATDPVNFPTEFQFRADTESGSNEFLIPSMGMVYKFNRKISLGFAAVGNGANTRFDADDNFFSLTDNTDPNAPPIIAPAGVISWGTLGVNLLQMQMLLSSSYKVNKQHVIGASLVGAVQQFRGYGLGNFGGIFNFSSDVNNLTNRGNDWSYGCCIKLGWVVTFLDKRLQLGTSYSSRVYMTEFEKYRGLFAEQGDFDIPENYSIGLSYKFTPKLTVAFDYQRINYSDIASIGNTHPTTSLNDLCTRPISNPNPCSTPGAVPQPTSRALGEDDGFGFGWEDMNVFKLGVNYALNDKWELRAGWNYGESPVPDSQLLFSMIAPAIIEHHGTLGLTYKPNKKMEWNANYTHGFENSQVCAVNDGCLSMVTQRPGNFIAAEMEIRALGIAFAYKL